jgi:hypothetical protein
MTDEMAENLTGVPKVAVKKLNIAQTLHVYK